MDVLFTVKQVQDLLKIDRLTVYRMLKDGRLTGVKVGHQWRFSRDEIDSMLSAAHPSTHQAATPNGKTPLPDPTQVLPLHCLQLIQDVFSDVAQVGAVTTSPAGEPLTEFSNPCRFCKLIMSSPQGKAACMASWRKLSEQGDAPPEFVTCHAGLQYARGRIAVNGQLAAMIITGQFYASPPNPAEAEERIERLAEKYGLDPKELARAAADITVLDGRKQEQMPNWLESVARTFEHIGHERAELMGRLRTIAAMSTFD